MSQTGDLPEWGIFKDGALVLEADNMVSLDYKRDYTVSDYPIEPGPQSPNQTQSPLTFQSYNKVQTPFDVRIMITKGGSVEDRSDFLQTLETIVGDLNLYDVQTPEQIYSNVNLIHYDMRRTAENGATLLRAEVWGEEIRTSDSSQFNDTKSPDGQNPQNQGVQSGQTPTGGQQGMLHSPGPT